MDMRSFLTSYCRVVRLSAIGRISLKEKDNYDCIFWRDGGCSVYPHRPLQCRSYPFWSPNLASRSAWDSLDPTCPGVNQGDLHSRTEIDDWLKTRLEEPFIDADDPIIREFIEE